MEEPKKIWKNVILVAFSFMVLFTAHKGMGSFQSSINREDGLGSTSQAVIYASLVFGTLFVPSLVIDKIGVKWALVTSMLCYSVYIAAQFYPTFYTLIPAAVILGVGAAPLWIAKCTYISVISASYAGLTGQRAETVMVRFFGIFFCIFQTSGIWGSLISSLVLSTGESAGNKTRPSEDQLALCGANYCPAASSGSDDDNNDDNENFKTSKADIYLLASIFLFFALLGPLMVTMFVDQISSGPVEKSSKATGCSLLVATIGHMKNPSQLLIIPITIWSGLEQGFKSADFTAAFVTCAYGVEKIGFVAITYYICNSAGALSLGHIVKYTGRIPVFVLATIINGCVISVFFTWGPNPDQGYVFFILSGLWGIADSIWQAQINALYGTLFVGHEEAAFSNYRLWESFGFLVAFILQSQICVDVKLWILVAFLSTGMVGYLTVERIERKRCQPTERKA